MTLIPASIAKRKTEENLIGITNKQLDAIAIKIDDAIRGGRNSIQISELSNGARERLGENGYKVLVNAQRDDWTGGYTISW